MFALSGCGAMKLLDLASNGKASSRIWHSDSLNPDFKSHIWLLHHLFFPFINDDMLEWAERWNHHKMNIQGEQQHSPLDMFYLGMIENGVCDFLKEPTKEEVKDPSSYGIDWNNIDDHNRML